MFTGIITHLGRVYQTAAAVNSDLRLTIEVDQTFANPAIGDSVACAGVCLTVVEVVNSNSLLMSFEVSNETLRVTTIADWKQGKVVNLESALKVGQPLGGHLVLGHVDGLAEVVSLANIGSSYELVVRLPEELLPYVAAKGSLAIEGVSLTVNRVEQAVCSINLVPHTWASTSLSKLIPGDKIQVEIDPLARYAVHALKWLKG